LKLLAIIDMRKFTDLFDEVIQISLSFSNQFIILQSNGFVWNGRYKTAWKAFNNGRPHFIKLIVSPVYIDLSFFILPNNMIHCIFHESWSPQLIFHNAQFNTFTKFVASYHRCISKLTNFNMIDFRRRFICFFGWGKTYFFDCMTRIDYFFDVDCRSRICLWLVNLLMNYFLWIWHSGYYIKSI